MPELQPHGRLALALGLAFALRVILILWSFYQDANSAVKYTDIDYVVFTDAARCVVRPTSPACALAQGPLRTTRLGDPYARDTYRYTPLLALLAVPNITLHPAFAKAVFALADLALGAVLYALLRRRGTPEKAAVTNVTVVWLLNPIIANISTRGSAESVLGLLVVTTLALAEMGRWRSAAVMFGLAVHFKVFPIIYGSSLLAAITAADRSRRWITYRHLEFGILSFASFMLLNAGMYLLCVRVFLDSYNILRLLVDGATPSSSTPFCTTSTASTTGITSRHTFTPSTSPLPPPPPPCGPQSFATHSRRSCPSLASRSGSGSRSVRKTSRSRGSCRRSRSSRSTKSAPHRYGLDRKSVV